MDKQLKIGDVSELTWLSRHTLRYYEKIGLIDPERKRKRHRWHS